MSIPTVRIERLWVWFGGAVRERREALGLSLDALATLT